MVNHGISVLFLRFQHGNVHTFQMETMHGGVLSTKHDAKGRFDLWIASSIKDLLSEKVAI